MALNHFDEHCGTVLDWPREDLQQVALIVAVHQNTQIMDGFHIFLDTAHPVWKHLVIAIGHPQKFDATRTEFLYRVKDITCDHSDMLHTWSQVVVEIFFDLAFLPPFG